MEHSQHGTKPYFRNLEIDYKMIKKLDRYIIGKFLSTFFFTILLFLAVATVIDLGENIDSFIDNNASGSDIVKFYFTFSPYIAFMLFPLFLFISVIFFTSRLASRTEIVAILSSGVSFYRILFGPYLFCALLLTGLQLYANHKWVPDANKFRIEFMQKFIWSTLKNRDNNIHKKIDKDTYLYMENYIVSDSSANKFSIEKFKYVPIREARNYLSEEEISKLSESDSVKVLVEKLRSKKIKWVKDKWVITDYYHRISYGYTEKVASGRTLDTLLNIHPKEFIKRDEFKEAMTTRELNEYLDREKSKGTSGLESYEVEKHRRTAIPFATIFLTIIGMAIASRKVRGGMGFHILIGFALSSIYVILLQFSQTFSTQGGLPPLIGVWIPNIIFGLLSIYILRIAPK